MNTSSVAVGVVSLGCLAGSSVLVAATGQRPGAAPEQWVNPGVGPASPADAVQFVRRTDGGFLGVLEGTSADFADDRHEYLFTHLRFRVTEWVYNSAGRSSSDRLDVLTLGGTYVERGGQRVPSGTADVAKGLQVGHQYFVPVKYVSNPTLPWNGQALLAAPDALSAVDSDKVVSVTPESRWPQAIIQSAVITAATPGAVGTERQQFVSALRLAAARK